MLKIVSPNKIYFGLKDYQQFKIIEKLIEKEFSQIEIYGIETVRDENGLALSSRNKLINQPNKEIYKNFINSINEFVLSLNPDTKIKDANELVEKFLQENSYEIKKFEYHEFRSLEALSLEGQIKNSRLFLAFYIHATRLIDNIKI